MSCVYLLTKTKAFTAIPVSFPSSDDHTGTCSGGDKTRSASDTDQKDQEFNLQRRTDLPKKLVKGFGISAGGAEIQL